MFERSRFLGILFSALSIAFIFSFAPGARAEFPDKITLGDKTYECLSVDEIRKLGFECEDIPWKDNAARVLIDAMNSFKNEPGGEFQVAFGKALKSLDFGDIAPQMEKYLKDNERTLDLLKQADAMPKYLLPTFKSKDAAEDVLPLLSRVQALARLLNHKAEFDFYQGKVKDAVDESFMTCRLGRRMGGTTRNLITWLVGVAVEGIGTKGPERMVLTGKLDEATLKDLAERLEKLASANDLARAFHVEGIGRQRSVDRFEKMPREELDALLKRYDLPDAVDKELEWDTVRKNYAEFYKYAEAMAGKPVSESLKPENSVGAWQKSLGHDLDPLTRTGISAFGKICIANGRNQVGFDALRIRVALERYKLANAIYPRTLADLVPAYLDKLPTDPFSANPYGYRTEDDGNYIFWSVGEDLKDNGGVGGGTNPWNGPDYIFTNKKP